MPLPDFVIIGAMKCGTSTLYAQLRGHPSFYLPVPKEPSFFSSDCNYERGFGWYLSLFDPAPPGTIVGEASTDYTKRPTHPKAFERLRLHLPDVRLIYLMRNPIDRLISHYTHARSLREMEYPLEDAIARHPELVDYGRYAMQLQPYVDAFGFTRILPVFLERMALAPQREFNRICQYLGYTGAVNWDATRGRENASNERLRETGWGNWLERHPGARRRLRAIVPAPMRRRLNQSRRMESRPEISQSCRRALEKVFDADLRILGSWMGVELTTARFNEVVENGSGLDFASRPLEA